MYDNIGYEDGGGLHEKNPNRLRCTTIWPNDRKLTREHLAEICDISTNHLRQIEKGDKLPSMPILVSLCNALEVSPNYLLQDSVPAVMDNAPDNILNMLLHATPTQAEIIESMVRSALERICPPE